MTVPEHLSWLEFFKVNPFDDYHRFHRPAALVAHSMSGVALDDLLAYLEPAPVPPTVNDGGFSAADLATMKAFGAKPPAKG